MHDAPPQQDEPGESFQPERVHSLSAFKREGDIPSVARHAIIKRWQGQRESAKSAVISVSFVSL
jgi:hypothetical protein